VTPGFENLTSVMPDQIRHPATARLRRERVFRDQGLDHAGPGSGPGWRIADDQVLPNSSALGTS